jgi:hypothetical protein
MQRKKFEHSNEMFCYLGTGRDLQRADILYQQP